MKKEVDRDSARRLFIHRQKNGYVYFSKFKYIQNEREKIKNFEWKIIHLKVAFFSLQITDKTLQFYDYFMWI